MTNILINNNKPLTTVEVNQLVKQKDDVIADLANRINNLKRAMSCTETAVPAVGPFQRVAVEPFPKIQVGKASIFEGLVRAFNNDDAPITQLLAYGGAFLVAMTVIGFFAFMLEDSRQCNEEKINKNLKARSEKNSEEVNRALSEKHSQIVELTKQLNDEIVRLTERFNEMQKNPIELFSFHACLETMADTEARIAEQSMQELQAKADKAAAASLAAQRAIAAAQAKMQAVS